MEIDLALKIEEVLKSKKSAGLCMNVDGAIGAIVAVLGLKPQAGKALFIIPRSLGILAQLLEQEAGSFFRPSNESVIYTDPKIGRERL